jgi:hypothetical protein
LLERVFMTFAPGLVSAIAHWSAPMMSSLGRVVN